jgi:hypothetical protein
LGFDFRQRQEALIFYYAQTGSRAYPVSYTVDIGNVSPGVKWEGREADHSPPSSAEVKNGRRLLTTAARVRTQVRSCGIGGGQNGTKAGFLRVLQFPLSILIPLTAPHSLIILPSTLHNFDTDSVVK